MSYQIQSIMFPKEEFSLIGAKMWLKNHEYYPLKVDTTQNFYRFRLQKPIKGNKYRIVHFGDYIMAVIDYGKSA